MNTISRDAAHTLAVAYNAYLEASYANRDDLQFWAALLLAAQRQTGVEIIPTVRLLYPLTGDATLTNVTVQTARASVSPAMVDDTPEPFDGYPIVKQVHSRDDDGPSPSLVPIAKSPPRKPSPSSADASPASRAAAFFARKA